MNRREIRIEGLKRAAREATRLGQYERSGQLVEELDKLWGDEDNGVAKAFFTELEQLTPKRPVCVVLYHEFPPIPTRAFDWCAYDDNRGESSPVGYGETSQAAVADLFAQLEDEE